MSEHSDQKTRLARTDGGDVAIAGFLYQMFTSAYDFARLLSPLKNVGAGNCETLVQFEAEKFNQDQTHVSSNAQGESFRTLTQCKFSLNPSGNDISPSEFQDIVDTLLKSEEAANVAAPLDSRLELRTNRPPSPETRNILEATAGRGNDHDLVKQRVLERKPEGGKNYKIIDRDPRIVSGMRRLEWVTIDLGQAREGLEEACRRFGLYTLDEFHERVRQIIGLFVEVSTGLGSHEIKQAAFNEVLAGIKSPRSIVAAEIAGYLREELASVCKDELLISPGRNFIFRDAQKKLAELTDETIVFITGDGGFGKSVVLAQALDAAMVQRSGDQRMAALLTEGNRCTFAALVARWRTTGHAIPTLDTDEIATARIVEANRGSQFPLLTIGLDGADQARYEQTWDENVSDWIKHFWMMDKSRNGIPPPVRLLVTCRSIDDVRDLLLGSGGPLQRVVVDIRVGPFTESELALACNSEDKVATEARDQLVSTAALLAAQSDSPANRFEPQTLRGSSPAALSPVVVKAVQFLQHPVIWRQYVELDGDSQLGLLQGAEDAYHRLAERYLTWLRARAKKRRGYDEQIVSEVLSGAAAICVDAEKQYPDESWKTCLDATGCPINRRNFTQELESSGLIFRDPAKAYIRQTHWRWRHEFVLRFLLSKNRTR